jgi:hypothetical protein
MDDEPRACVICHEKDGVVNPPDLDLGYALSFEDGMAQAHRLGLIGLASTLYNNFLPYL